jgi:ribosomal protein L7/L12
MSGHHVPPETRVLALELLGQGKMIEAVKLVREATRLSLKDAKEYVDGLRLEMLARVVPPDVAAHVRYLIATGKWREAVKEVRGRTMLGRLPAKQYVNALRAGVDLKPGLPPGTQGPGMPLPGADNGQATLSERVRAFERAKDHASAVALVQAETGMSHAEAERFVSALD